MIFIHILLMINLSQIIRDFFFFWEYSNNSSGLYCVTNLMYIRRKYLEQKL